MTNISGSLIATTMMPVLIDQNAFSIAAAAAAAAASALGASPEQVARAVLMALKVLPAACACTSASVAQFDLSAVDLGLKCEGASLDDSTAGADASYYEESFDRAACALAKGCASGLDANSRALSGTTDHYDMESVEALAGQSSYDAEQDYANDEFDHSGLARLAGHVALGDGECGVHQKILQEAGGSNYQVAAVKFIAKPSVAEDVSACVTSCLPAASPMQAASKPPEDAPDIGLPATSTAECKANALLAAMSIKAELWLQNATTAEIEAMMKS